MNVNDEKIFFASCPMGCEEILEQEANNYELSPRIKKGGISFKTDIKTAIRFLMSTRVASRVFMEVGFFFINHEKEIYRKASDIAWEEVLTTRDTFKINTILDRESNKKYKNSVFLSQTLKDALVDRMRKVHGKRPSVELKTPSHSFLQRVETTSKSSKVILYLDLCGKSLDKRGYRSGEHFAPLRENLAAAILLASDWDSQNESLYEPMVGSGTILIEAIMQALNIEPTFIELKNVKRPFSFTRHQWFRDMDLLDWYHEQVEDIIDTARAKIANIEPNAFFANDIDERNIKLTKKHLRKCFGKIDFVTFTNNNFLNMKTYPDVDVVFMNPPYGKRLGQEDDIKQLHHDIGETLKNNFNDTRAFIFTIKDDLHKEIRLKTSSKKAFFNGDIECRLLQYNLN